MTIESIKPPISADELAKIKVGDVVERLMAGQVKNQLEVVEITDTLIRVEDRIGFGADWNFERNSGIELDPDIRGSYSGTDENGKPKGWAISWLTRIVPIDEIEIPDPKELEDMNKFKDDLNTLLGK